MRVFEGLEDTQDNEMGYRLNRSNKWVAKLQTLRQIKLMTRYLKK